MTWAVLEMTARVMQNTCMATKTISLKLEAYEKLRTARRYSSESFSNVVLRARWPEETVTGSQLLSHYREHGPHFTEEELDQIEQRKADDGPPDDKWSSD